MDRRSFLKNAGLLAPTLFVSLKSFPFSDLGADKIVSGRVLSGKKGIGGVVVSDGFNVTLSDAAGNYKISIHKDARFVWISTPAGHEFNEEDNIARHYYQAAEDSKLDFYLKPLKKNDNRHNFIIWADPQVKNKKDVEQMMDTSVPDVVKIVKDMGKVPVHGIGVGDLVWDNHELFPDYERAVAEMGIPFFQALGNHDQDYRQGGDEASDVTFGKHFGPTYYSFNRGQAHYVVLDDVRYLGREREYDGYISEQQLDWLKKDLQYVPKDNLVIVCLHIPVHNAVKNNAALYDVLKSFSNVHIMSGHTHYNRNVITDGIFEHNHGTVCGAWWTGPVCEDGTPRGYGVYEVDGKKLKWHYRSTGQDKSYQLKVFADTLTNQKRIIANVWNWDPEWKVEYYADGKLMGPLQQEKGFDPDTVTLYKGNKLPVGRVFPEPRKTDHLFVAHLDVSVRHVKVVATDRFGDVYVAETNV